MDVKVCGFSACSSCVDSIPFAEVIRPLARVQMGDVVLERTLREHIGPGCIGEKSQHESDATA
jgi:hypothetical protein